MLIGYLTCTQNSVLGQVDCSGEITSVGTEFTSPNHPNDYPNNVECTQVIRFEEGKQIQLKFLEFSLEKSSVCG